ncbi:MAG: hypothetical protein ACLP9K_04300 [Nitrososphaerales archaeon]
MDVETLSGEEHRPLTYVYAQPVHVTLTRNAKGTYQWEISVHAETVEKTLEQVNQVDKELDEKYGATTE